MNTTYYCKKFRRNVYLVFRAAFSCWSCFPISLLYFSKMASYSMSSRLPSPFLKRNIIQIINLTCLLYVPVYYTSQLHIQSEMHMWWTPHMKNLRFTPLCAAPTSCKRLTQLKQLDVLCRLKNIHVLYYRFRPNSAFIIHS